MEYSDNPPDINPLSGTCKDYYGDFRGCSADYASPCPITAPLPAELTILA